MWHYKIIKWWRILVTSHFLKRICHIFEHILTHEKRSSSCDSWVADLRHKEIPIVEVSLSSADHYFFLWRLLFNLYIFGFNLKCTEEVKMRKKKSQQSASNQWGRINFFLHTDRESFMNQVQKDITCTL